MFLCRRSAVVLVTTLMAAGSTSASMTTITSTFDNGAEGWGGSDDFTAFQWSNEEGNLAGAIQARDRGLGPIWKYAASSAYWGDRSDFLGGTLSWEILGITGSQTSVFNRADVILRGGGLEIGIDTDLQPLVGTWVGETVVLDASQNWKIVSNFAGGNLSSTDATQAQILQVLSNLDGLFIQGEYTNGADASALDNVELKVPASGTATFGAVCASLLLRRRR